MSAPRTWIVRAMVMACALVPVSSAQAHWSSPFTVARTAVDGPLLAASPTNGATVAWLGGEPGRYVWLARRITADGTLAPARRFAGGSDHFLHPELGVDRSGAVVLVWSVESAGTSRVLARRMSPSGRLGRIRTIATEQGVLPETIDEQLAVDGAGNATIAWHRVTGYATYPKGEVVTGATVRLRRLRADGSLGPVRDITATEGRTGSARIDLAASGRGAITWVRIEGDRAGVRARLIRRDGTLGSATELAPLAQYWSGQSPAVDVEPSGRATIAWVVNDGHGVATRRLSGRGLGPLHTLTAATPGESFWPQVAVDAHGTATIAWRDAGTAEDGFINLTQARQIRADRTLGPLRTLSAPGISSSMPRVAADGLGRTTVIWSSMQPGSREVTLVQVRTLARDGRPGVVHTLARDDASRLSGQPQIVADRRGVVTAVWAQRTGTTYRLRGARLTRRPYGH